MGWTLGDENHPPVFLLFGHPSFLLLLPQNSQCQSLLATFLNFIQQKPRKQDSRGAAKKRCRKALHSFSYLIPCFTASQLYRRPQTGDTEHTHMCSPITYFLSHMKSGCLRHTRNKLEVSPKAVCHY